MGRPGIGSGRILNDVIDRFKGAVPAEQTRRSDSRTQSGCSLRHLLAASHEDGAIRSPYGAEAAQRLRQVSHASPMSTVAIVRIHVAQVGLCWHAGYTALLVVAIDQ